MPVSITPSVAASNDALVAYDEAVDFVLETSSDDENITQKDANNLQRLINEVSKFFKTYIGRTIRVDNSLVDYINGGRVFILKNYPLVSVSNITDLENNEEVNIDSYRTIDDLGEIIMDYDLTEGIKRYKVEYAAGYAELVADVPDDWKLNCKIAVNYLWNKELSQFTRTEEGFVISPKIMPPLVIQFLNSQKGLKI